MTCNTIDLGNGETAIVCSRGRKPRRCTVCNRNRIAVLCDFPLAGKKTGKTCSRGLCERCAVHVGPDRDLCPAHGKAEAVQLTLPCVAEARES